MIKISYSGYRFPPEIIHPLRQARWSWKVDSLPIIGFAHFLRNRHDRAYTLEERVPRHGRMEDAQDRERNMLRRPARDQEARTRSLGRWHGGSEVLAGCPCLD